MDNADFAEMNLEMSGWAEPLAFMKKQPITCHHCGGEAFYDLGRVHCIQSCGIVEKVATPSLHLGRET